MYWSINTEKFDCIKQIRKCHVFITYCRSLWTSSWLNAHSRSNRVWCNETCLYSLINTKKKSIKLFCIDRKNSIKLSFCFDRSIKKFWFLTSASDAYSLKTIWMSLYPVSVRCSMAIRSLTLTTVLLDCKTGSRLQTLLQIRPKINLAEEIAEKNWFRYPQPTGLLNMSPWRLNNSLDLKADTQ